LSRTQRVAGHFYPGALRLIAGLREIVEAIATTVGLAPAQQLRRPAFVDLREGRCLRAE
jgi:hypothetical protein